MAFANPPAKSKTKFLKPNARTLSSEPQAPNDLKTSIHEAFLKETVKGDLTAQGLGV